MPRSGWVAVGAIVATALGSRVGPVALDPPSVAAAALLALAVAPWSGTRLRTPLVAVGIGALAIALRLALAGTPPTPPAEIAGRGPWDARVLSMGSPRDGEQVGMLEVLVPAGEGAGERPVILAATLPRYPAIEPGDRIEVAGRARARPDSDYGRYLERIGAWGTLQVASLRHVQGADEGPGRALERLRRAAGDALAAVLPEPEAGLAAGILVGLRDRVDRALAADFTTAGVSHVVAISGWNIAIVAAVIAALTGRLGRRRRSIVTALAVIGYVAFAGASPSVVRAGAMAGVVLLARESGRAGRAATALGWAVALLLLADPDLIADAGFQLSSLATAGLIAWATPLTSAIERAGRGRVPHWLAESLGVSFAAQAATLPVVLAAFGRLALVSPLVNLLIVPIVPPAMAVGLAALVGGALVLAGAPAWLGALLALPGWIALRLMVGIVGAAADLPGASLEIDAGSKLAAAAASVGMLAALIAWRRRHRIAPRAGRDPVRAATRPAARPATNQRPGRRVRRLATLGLVGTLAVTAGVAASRPTGVARLTVLDVGQGDAILVEGGRGGRLLVDGGPDPDRLLVELDRRIPPWDRRIDAVVLTHPHEDHVAGLALLLERYRVGRVFEPGMRGPGPGYAAWQDRLAGGDSPPRAGLAAGDRLAVDGIDLRVLWPIRGAVPADPPDDGTGINNVSIVLLGNVGSRRFLLTGDVENGVDPRLLAAGLPRVDVLKIAHHGSRTATTEAFVAAVRPLLAIASAGSGNPYGHPARPTLERLAAAGARVYRTDRDGSVSVAFRSDGMDVAVGEPRTADVPPARTAPPARTVAAGAGRPTAAFWCAIPLGPGPATRPTEPATPPEPGRTLPHPALDAGRPALVGYHRVDDGALPAGGREPAGLPGSPDLVPGARLRRGGYRGVAGRPGAGRRDRGRSPRGRGRGPPPRRGQDPPRERPGQGAAAWRGLGRVAAPAGPPGAGTARGRSPGDAPGRRRGPPALGRRRVPGGAHRGLRRQARGPAPRADGRSLRGVVAPLPGQLGRGHGRGRPGAGGAPRAGGVPTRGLDAGRRPAAALVAGRPARGGARRPGRRVTAPCLYVWGDDDLLARRRIDAFAAELAQAGGGEPLERFEVVGRLPAADEQTARLAERLLTPVMFGGGTLAIVHNPGALTRSTATRERLIGAIRDVAPGNATVIVEATNASAKGPGQKRIADAITAAGGSVKSVRAPTPAGLGAWIETEARDRGLPLGPGAAGALAERLGSRVTEGDVDRRYLSRIASSELDKLALRHALDGGAITPADVEALVAQAAPGSLWSLTDALGERRADAAIAALDRLWESTPEPVLVAVLHRRIIELVELGDRLASGAVLPDAARAMRIASEFRAGKLAEQARRWSGDELRDTLHGLLELDASGKGSGATAAAVTQRRLAWTLWLRDHVPSTRAGR